MSFEEWVIKRLDLKIDDIDEEELDDLITGLSGLEIYDEYLYYLKNK